MAHTKLVAVEGIAPRNQQPASVLDNTTELGEDTFEKLLNDIQWLERFLSGETPTGATNISRNFVSYVRASEIGNHKLQNLKVSKEYGTKKLIQNEMLRETEFPLENLNKVFCSAWLNDRQILFGTKCNKLIVLDIPTKKLVQIPGLKSSNTSIPPKNQCGIHALQINPSRTLVATGAMNSNDVAVYKLPTLDPVCVGEGAHKDWVFDITWLDDEFFVSGSRDTTIALWRVTKENIQNPSSSSNSSGASSSLPKCSFMQPLNVKLCKNAEKVRALLFNEQYQELVALSLNAYLHLWDAQTFKQKFSRKLPKSLENVCIAQEADHSLYAVGSRSYVTLLDSRTLQSAQKVPSKYQSCGIRSLSFLGNLLTIGTGVGVVLFYDIRSCRYLEKEVSPLGPKDTQKDSRCKKYLRFKEEQQPALLRTTRGFVYQEDEMYAIHFSLEYNPAIYTHCYDTSGTRLFLAGGPLPVNLQGNYAALWQ